MVSGREWRLFVFIFFYGGLSFRRREVGKPVPGNYEDITDLSNYFVTSEGEDFISVFLDALEKAKEIKSAIEIVSI